MLRFHTIFNPINLKIKLINDSNKTNKKNIKWFQEVIKFLLYLVLGIKSDITYTTFKLAKFFLILA